MHNYNYCEVRLYPIFDHAIPTSYFTVIICPALADVSNSELSYDSSGEFVHSTVASFVCLDGYYLVGSGTRTCTGNGLTITGTWTGSNPSCEGKYECA